MTLFLDIKRIFKKECISVIKILYMIFFVRFLRCLQYKRTCFWTKINWRKITWKDDLEINGLQKDVFGK